MEIDFDFFGVDEKDAIPEKGRVLISEPFLQDIYFKRSIVLLTEHNEEGTVGFVLNKPINLKINEVLNDFPKIEVPVSLGGPVNTNTIHYIHSLGDIIPGSVKILPDLYWGGDFDAVKQLLESEKLDQKRIRFFLGYSGWSASQLENELSENSWIVTDLPQKDILTPPMRSFWKKVLNSMGNKYSLWPNFPENPQFN